VSQGQSIACAEEATKRISYLLGDAGYEFRRGEHRSGRIDFDDGPEWWFVLIDRDGEETAGPACVDNLSALVSAVDHALSRRAAQDFSVRTIRQAAPPILHSKRGTTGA
jgi:hypothetical protein